MSAADALTLTATEARDRIATGDLTAEAYTRACLERIEARESEVQAWVHLDPALALEQARTVDKARAAGERLGPLAGLPVGIKDIIDTADQPTENGTPIFAGHRPAKDAACVALLRQAGAVIMGKTVTTELANIWPNKTRNPRNLGHTPGGSSSGSAAAVADRMVPLALGTQTGGSVIRPASFCGIFGLKPTVGLVDRRGVTMQSHTLDTVGVYGRSVEDLALVAEPMSAFDADDVMSWPRGSLGLLAQVRAPRQSDPRFGFYRTPVWEEAAEPATKRLLPEVAKLLGSRAREVAIAAPFDRICDFHRVVMAAEDAHYYKTFFEERGDLLSPGLKQRLAEARTTSAMEYLDAVEKREVCYRLFEEALGTLDALVVPAAPGPAPKGFATTGNAIFNGLWTYLGVPCVTLPLLESDGMPLGVQLVGRRREDGALLASARWLAERFGKARV
jgi:Asp-tRNA(Asn)/Glu-tRNA(Gln) amidotransferase A subunit family amidase